ncbi:putative hydrolase C777.06c isoform X2 [Amborella trichopoda]|uniref:putative hydrolase C777.06c isoform X2 n=1 Tax=Amborella trichopoda TaxID=13333 RepID=UPI0009BE7973|nr:putative hydrolase C777.06c isoform X2 [Amborella trichopoda]|eukprot:XP_020528816.1 putative hydrolase C777.06c isoform X2 [Amborella trichopoda]
MPPSHSLLMNTFLSSFSTPSLSLCPFSFLEMRWKTMSAAMRIRRPLQIRFQSIPGRDSEIIFMGTGTSEGIPRVSCLTNPTKACPVCSKALEPGNKNNRLNTSILICYSSSLGRHNILVDAGKFFYHSALKWFPKFGLRSIDAVIITHSHADAIGGLDDLRDWTNNVQPYIPIYVTARDFEVMKKTHYYIVDTSVVTPGAAVSELQFNIIKDEPFVVHNLEVTPLPVWHGNGYHSLGFRFGNICYISDVSELPEETYPLLNDCDLLILDALRPDRSSSTHFGLPRALEEVRKIQPRKTLFTGMMHLMDHEKVNQDLAKLLETEGLDVQLSYDGLRIPVNLEGFGSRCKPLSAKEFI